MATDDIKEYLTEHGWLDNEKESDLKRVSKKKQNGYYLRLFENKETGKQGYVVTMAEDHEYAARNPIYTDNVERANFWEAGETLFGISDYEGNVCVSFAPRSFFEREDCIPDWHCEDVLQALYGIEDGPFIIDETCENMFMFWENDEETKNVEKVRAFLESKGLIFDKRLDFSEHYG